MSKWHIIQYMQKEKGDDAKYSITICVNGTSAYCKDVWLVHHMIPITNIVAFPYQQTHVCPDTDLFIVFAL